MQVFLIVNRVATQFLKRLSLIVMVLTLSACSAFSLIYERLEWLTVFQFDSMFDLSEEQKDIVRQATTESKAWLSSEGFPKLVKGFSRAKSLWDAGELATSTETFESETQAFVSEALGTIGLFFEPFALSMTEQNAAHYREYIEDEFDNWFDYAESDRSKWAERKEEFEKWFGELSRRQNTILKKYFTVFPNERAIREANTLAWVDRFIEASLADDQEALREWVADPKVWWTDDYRRIQEANLEQSRLASQSLHRIITREQRRHASKRIGGWIDTLSEL